ncbi:hypothetical protein FJT64_016069 [Amphibalanus amphitrite]|uniref:Uncharacterized protein n=1 Tax=Amphibalanus amphitrite TaxID=1232801 RepID=A0A6A4XBN6_AMPAM|nr:hypothetical protein FJT64_016069 [Amphibalanus amphitrite]
MNMNSGVTKCLQLLLKTVFVALKLTCAAGLICLVSLEIAEFIAGELITTTQYLNGPPNPKISFCNSFFIPHEAWNESVSPRDLFNSLRPDAQQTILYFDSIDEDEETPILAGLSDEIHYTIPNRLDVNDRGMYMTYCHPLSSVQKTRHASSHQLNVALRRISNTAAVMFHPGELPRSARYLDVPVVVTQYNLRPSVAEAVVSVSWGEYRRLNRPDAPCSEAADVWSCPERCRMERAVREVNCAPFFLLDLLSDIQTASSSGSGMVPLQPCDTLQEFTTFHRRFHEVIDDCDCPRATCDTTSVNLDVTPRRDARFSDFELRTLLLFRRRNVVSTTEHPAMTWTSFLADFGGNLGLLLGVSALTVVEALQHLLEKVVARNATGAMKNPNGSSDDRGDLHTRDGRYPMSLSGFGGITRGLKEGKEDVWRGGSEFCGRQRHLVGPGIIVTPRREPPQILPENAGDNGTTGSRRGSGVFTLTTVELG